MSDELHEDIREAISAISTDDDAPTPVEAAAKLEPEPPAEPAEPPKAEGEPPKAEGGAEPPKILTEDKAPRGWSPGSREKWMTLPEDIRHEILRREEASISGVRQLQERYAPMEGFIREIAPILQEASHYGVNAAQYIDRVMGAERVLRSADLPSKFQTILAIADQYGVPLRDIINESVGQKVLGPAQPQPQVPPEIMQELQEMRQWRSQVETRSTTSEIEAFAKNNEFFNDVHLKMAALVESGEANTLQDAYDAACWATPAIRKVLMDREAVKGRQTTAAGASPKPGAGVDVPAGDNEDDDLEATVRSAFNKSVTGRV